MKRLVFVHGASGNAETWSPVLQHFPQSTTLAIDLPGRGQSAGPALNRVSQLADHLADQLARASQGSPDKPFLIGHSLGGAVCLQLALDHPELLAGLVMVSSSSRLRVHPAILKMVAESSAQQPYRLDAAFGPGASSAIKDDYAKRAASTPPAAALADWQACDAFDVRARLAELSCPALVIHGDQDLLTPAKHQASLAQAIRAERVVLEGVGHMLPWEAPAALAQAILAWEGG